MLPPLPWVAVSRQLLTSTIIGLRQNTDAAIMLTNSHCGRFWSCSGTENRPGHNEYHAFSRRNLKAFTLEGRRGAGGIVQGRAQMPLFLNRRTTLHTCAAAAAAAAAGGPTPGSEDVGTRNRLGFGLSSWEGLGHGARQTAEQRYKDELHTLNVAITANMLIFAAKLWAHFMSGSSSMLAEAMHSVADVLNQMLLRIGLLKAQKGPTEMHPYGYARDRFIWSLISAVGIFFLGAGASFIHGLHTLMEHRELEHMGWSYGVLLVSGLLEGYSLWVASRVVVSGATARRMGLLQYIRSGMDPTTVAVMMEDGGAVLGLVIAGVCTALAQATGNAMWDAAGSILVGCLLGIIAIFLVQKNRQLLIGRSMAPADVAAVQALLRADPVVAYVTDTKTEEIGPAMYRFKAEVAWDGDQVVQRYLDRCGGDRLIGRLQTAAEHGDREAMERVMRSYGRDLVSAVGAEVDRIESAIQKMNPGILYVDLETDRGRHDSWRRGAAALGIQGAGSADGLASYGGSVDEYFCSTDDLVLHEDQNSKGPLADPVADSGAVATSSIATTAAAAAGTAPNAAAEVKSEAVASTSSDGVGGSRGAGISENVVSELDLSKERWGPSGAVGSGFGTGEPGSAGVRPVASNHP
ncbi:hypothetical protein Vafri_14861 [Volvox africanus]|uniref:Cation efflux protein transmembrane domain-containing protein n=2 Tax=Volvox africanus TaxID=51714 RepID=A0A8J4BF94_9CHLO|nr:hypothetical protein Vafri_14861 [Volvox africanus]